jgi:hypothetical protein
MRYFVFCVTRAALSMLTGFYYVRNPLVRNARDYGIYEVKEHVSDDGLG